MITTGKKVFREKMYEKKRGKNAISLFSTFDEWIGIRFQKNRLAVLNRNMF
ncbi:hypothetical protein LEP1GSC060_1406 [Leptospira weilii serovar Ranarum str. ICFT]|uniref:Uncharacterized protein n=1 Tax=Leptospira weilii serovar Ranarum str. ICFT TaxID=1218598 RepID=N1WQX9_9LEPT|nr:hypothetical protein LEP1GSC060_1406 [Leptospira weilii serovar Ranarum str. ICFT]